MSRADPGARIRLVAPPSARSAGSGRFEGWLTAGVFAVAVLFQLPIRTRWLALLDEGYILAIADDVNRGQVLYRDVTIDAPFPLAFHLLAGWFGLTETSIASSRWLATIVFAVYATAVFRVSRAVLPRGWALAFVGLVLCYRVWAFPHWQIYSYSMVAATLAVLAAALVCRAERTGARLLLVAAGLAAGAAIMAKQDYGGSVAFAMTVALAALPWLRPRAGAPLLERLRPPFLFMLGGAVVVLPYLGLFAGAGALDEMVQQTVVFPFSVMSSFSYPRLPALWPLAGQDAALRAEIGNYFPSILATLWWNDCPGCFTGGLGRGWLYRETAFWDVTLKLVFWAPVLLVGAAALVWGGTIVRERRRGSIAEASQGRLLVLALAAGFLLAFNPPRDWVHLMMIYPPALLVGAVLAHQATEPLPRLARRTAQVVLLGGLASLLVVTGALVLDLRRRVDHWLDAPRAGVYADRLNGPLIEEVLAWVERTVPPGTPLPTYPTQPALAFLAGRETVAGYHVIWPMQAADRDARILAELERRGVEHILFSVSQWAHLRSFQENAPELFDGLVDRWEIDRVFTREPNGPILLALCRRSKAAPGVELRGLVRDPESALRWVRWPFTDALSQPVGTVREPKPIRLSFSVPADRPILRTAIGMNPDRWLGAPIGALTFRVSRESAQGRSETLFEAAIDPRGDVSARRWIPVSVDLSEDAGRPVVLTFTIEGEGARGEPDDLAGWVAPVLVAPAATPP